MNFLDSPIGLIDADALAEDIDRIVSSLGSGRQATYSQKGGLTIQATAGKALATNETVRPVRIYRGAEFSRKEPAHDVGQQKVIILKSALDPITPQAGDVITEDNGRRYAVSNVDFGDVGPTRVYYLLDVAAVGRQ